MMYSKNVALNRELHADLTISPSPEGFRFAADSLTAMLAASEFFDAGRLYPIIFAERGEKGVLPFALLGLEEKENLFVDAEGNWIAQYIPAYVRRYPFITTDGAEGQMTVCFDESFDGFNLEGGVPLFENGEPTEKTKEIQSFLQNYFQQMQQTELFCAMLKEKELLRQISAQASLRDGRKYALNGMLVIDEQKLAQLPDDEIVKLFRNGMLALIHAHLLSLRNISSLAERKEKIEKSDA